MSRPAPSSSPPARNDAVRFEGSGGTSVSFDAAARKVTSNSADSVSLSLGRSAGQVMGQITASNKQTESFGDGYLAFSTSRAEVVAERVRIDQDGNVGIGTSGLGAKLHVESGVYVNGDITSTGNIAARFQDVAEWVPSVRKLATGTVVVLDAGRSNHVVASGSACDTKVAGVVSAEPGVILGVAGEDKVKVATTGRVLVRVDATRSPVKVGDLLVTSGGRGACLTRAASPEGIP